ncbi:replication-relaxation family protein [Actinoplanes sp. NPDC023714]|uniref:replication-relaxation family protein n=1 Tax=Actinoplanes sp. NPDC023714 TaxID=3154322 RepID=UPI0033C965F3
MASSLLSLYPRITIRDRTLLQLLDEHQVLTTGQIHRMLFRARRTCELRLRVLADLDLLERFRFFRDGGGTQPWHWTLGYNGRRFQASVHRRPELTPRASDQLVQRLSTNPHLNHLLVVNEFFVRLQAYSRRHPEARLDRWWSETTTSNQFRAVTADGHGLWSEAGMTAGFFLEADTGTEALGRVIAKLDRYAALVRDGGPRYPVLIWLGSEQREDHLHRLLRDEQPVITPVATATQNHEPADPVWLPAGEIHRVRLIELPSDHGAPTAANPNYGDDGSFQL